MKSQKPDIGEDGTLFGINVRGDSKINIGIKYQFWAQFETLTGGNHPRPLS